MDSKPGESLASPASSHWARDGSDAATRPRCKEKNRDAARKSRRKQTERADLLHEELQFLERSNAALEAEIASLRTESQRYTAALQDHEPRCTRFICFHCRAYHKNAVHA
uniref:BZIP domain-containing protein n=1 Tax=Denticeps clupeoides TaxID=299321 RepID=A0AAY4A233_9TELE